MVFVFGASGEKELILIPGGNIILRESNRPQTFNGDSGPIIIQLPQAYPGRIISINVSITEVTYKYCILKLAKTGWCQCDTPERVPSSPAKINLLISLLAGIIKTEVVL